MSEETTTEEMSEKSQADNFAELRAQRDALEAELRPLKVEKIVRDAGFDPTSGNGMALQDLLSFDADVETAKGIAAKYGWEPQKPVPQLSESEQVAASYAERAAQIASVTTSDDPGDWQTQVAEAENAGDWNKAVALKLQQAFGGQ